MNNAKSPKIAALLAATIILLISACGGGGGDTSSNSGFTASVNTNTKPQTSSADDTPTVSSSVSVESSSSSAISTLVASSSISISTSSSSSSSKTSSSASSSSKSSTSKSSSSAASNSSTPKISIDSAAPTIVSEFQITFTGFDIVALNWSAATDNVGVIAYKIYRNQIQIDQVDVTHLNYADFNVAPNSSYTYGVSAGDAAGNWSAVKSVLAKTLAAPIAPSSASSSSSSKSTSSASSLSNSSLSSISTSSLSSANNTSASSNSSLSSSSKSSSSSSAAPDITAPSAPTSVFQILVLTNRADIGWTAATDNIAVTTYRIYRDNVLVNTIGSAGALEYSDKTVAPNKLYTYGVEAGDAAGNWSSRKTIAITTLAANANGDVTLYWAPPTQREDGSNISSAELGGFLIRYKPKTDTDYTFIDIKNGSATSNIIANLSGDYEFQIAAYDSNSLYSTFVALTPK